MKIFNKKVENRVLVIGDLHCPFEKEGYLEFCKEQYKKWKCNKVIFIGDIIDCHYSSYHESNPDGYSAGQELDLAIERISKWYKAFPEATVILGNHDRIVARKMSSSGLSNRWMKSYSDVLKTPKWNYIESLEIDNVLYIHGDNGPGAKTRMKNEFRSIVSGHRHTECYIEWVYNKNNKCFAMQVGAGIDIKSYAMSYAKYYKPPVIACGVVINGDTPINIIMNK